MSRRGDYQLHALVEQRLANGRAIVGPIIGASRDLAAQRCIGVRVRHGYIVMPISFAQHQGHGDMLVQAGGVQLGGQAAPLAAQTLMSVVFLERRPRGDIPGWKCCPQTSPARPGRRLVRVASIGLAIPRPFPTAGSAYPPHPIGQRAQVNRAKAHRYAPDTTPPQGRRAALFRNALLGGLPPRVTPPHTLATFGRLTLLVRNPSQV